jgi:hypothetical protein
MTRNRCPRLAAAALAAAVLGALLAGGATASAAPTPGTERFGLTPAPGPGGQPRAYISLLVRPGGVARDSVIASNPSDRLERLRISVSRAVTAANSGSAFESIAGPCAAASCWIRLHPETVALAPGSRRIIPFTVAVPGGAMPGQYLAGITAAAPPQAADIGSAGRTSARAIIIDEITVGVAVTVLPMAGLPRRLDIPAVSAQWVGATPRLDIAVRNTGRTFLQGAGHITCRAGGQRHPYHVIMETVLPGGNAVLPVNAPGLRSGSWRCTVRLSYGGPRPATWSGTVTLPGRSPVQVFHPARSVYVPLPNQAIPPWALVLMVIGALLALGMAALLTLRLSQRRRPAGARASRARTGRSRLGLRAAASPRHQRVARRPFQAMRRPF